MIRRLFIMRATLAIIAVGCSTTAVAQKKATPALFTAAEVDRIAPMVDSGCILGPAAKTATGEEKVANCTAALAALEPMAAKAKSPAERAGFTYLIASFDFARTGGYLTIDRSRSTRVCMSSERAFAKMMTVNAALFEPSLATALQTSRAAISRSAAACRKDFGVPKGAPALLPQ